MTFSYEEAQREQSLWYCLTHKKRHSVDDWDSTKKADDKTNIPFTRRDETDLPPSPANHPETDHERDYRLEVKKYRVEVVTLIAVIIYAAIAAFQYCQMRVSNRNALLALHVSERAYITLGFPTLDQQTNFLKMQISNLGHIASSSQTMVIHQATIKLPNSTTAPDIKNAIDCHGEGHWFGPIPPGNNLAAVQIPAIKVSLADFAVGSEVLWVAGTVTYGDGFPDDGPQEWSFCFQSGYHSILKEAYWTDCDPSVILPQIQKCDDYPKGAAQK